MRVCRVPVDNRFRKQVIYTLAKLPSTVEFALLDEVPYVIYREQEGDSQQMLQVNSDGTVQAVQLALQRYSNGSSSGDRQNGGKYAIRDNWLCRCQDSGAWQVYSQNTASWFGLLHGNVYYLHKDKQGEGTLYQAEGKLQDNILIKEHVDTVTIADEYLLCKMAPEEDYGAEIFDKQGRLVLAITGAVDDISLSDGIVMVSRYTAEGSEYLFVMGLDK